jgi:hypothetical protein
VDTSTLTINVRGELRDFILFNNGYSGIIAYSELFVENGDLKTYEFLSVIADGLLDG